MTFFSAFTLSLGAMLALMAVVAAWLFRTSAAPFALKLAVPALLVTLACWTPYSVASMMGFPVWTAFDALPERAQLIAFVPHDEAHAVDLWLRVGADVPRVYETQLDEGLKQTLREARERMAHNREAMLTKARRVGGGDHGRPHGLGGIGDDQKAYVLDDSAFNDLPPKE